MKTLTDLQQELDAPIPRSAVKQREGAGRRSFSYLSADYVIDRNNRVFGNLNWSSITQENKCVFEGLVSDSYGKTKHCVSYIARVSIEAQHIDETGRVVRTSHCGTGYGDGSDANNPGKAHELAAKEAESDALKRACKNFGQSMGLALYDKEQTNVVDDEAPKTAPKPAVAAPAKEQSTAPSRPKLADAPDARPSFDRDNVNKRIATLAKIINAKGTKSFSNLKEEMRAQYGTDVKEQLKDEQAAALLTSLETLASA